MAIEATGLSDILLTPDVPLDPGNNTTGQDFSQFFSDLTAGDGQGAASDVMPSDDVGNPTPALPQGAEDVAGNPVQALMMIVDKLALMDQADVKVDGGEAVIPTVPTAESLGDAAEVPPQMLALPATKSPDHKATVKPPLPINPQHIDDTNPVNGLVAKDVVGADDDGPQDQDDSTDNADAQQVLAQSVQPQVALSVAVVPAAVAPVAPQTQTVDDVPATEVTATQAPVSQAIGPLASNAAVMPVGPEGQPNMVQPVVDGATTPTVAAEKTAVYSEHQAPVKQEKAGSDVPDFDLQALIPEDRKAALQTARGHRAEPTIASVIPDNALANLAQSDAAQTVQPQPVSMPTGHIQTPQAASTAQGQAAAPQHQQMLDDLLIGNSVEEQWVDRMSRDIQALISNDNREARLHLRPRELGDLSIRLDLNDGQAKVHFTVETAAAQALINDATSRLQAMLENRGVKLEQASVDVGGSGAGKNGSGGNDQRGAEHFMAKAQPEMLNAAIRRAVRTTAFERYA